MTTAPSKPKDRRGTWPQALGSMAASLLLILGIRWALFEPYVIPSGSMIPTLLIHDHILVNKFSFGVRVPFTNDYLFKWSGPRRGDVLVFRGVDEPDIFLIKRLVGLPGDNVTVEGDGRIEINDQPLPLRPLSKDEVWRLLEKWPEPSRSEFLSDYFFNEEQTGAKTHVVLQKQDRDLPEPLKYKVPAGQFFMMGDNRDNSADSRVWGFLPFDHVLGRASAIWLSCETLMPDSQLCDPKTIRWSRLFRAIR